MQHIHLAPAVRPRVTAPVAFGVRLANEERRFTQRGASWHAANRATGLRARFGPQGVALEPRTRLTGSWSLTLRTTALGRAGAMRAQGSVEPHEGACDDRAGAGATADCVRRLELDRGQGVVEVWRNTRRGLEQAFELARRPPGRGPIVIDVKFEGARAGRLEGDVLTLRSRDRDLLRYAELHARDAGGQILPATMSWRSVVVSLAIDDRDARYPIVVDPLLSAPSWTAEADQVDAQMGSAVSTAGDVNGDGYADVIVGAEGFDGGETDEGRVFVFHGGLDGLGAVAAWTAESDQEAVVSASRFGAAVSTAGDVDGDGYDDVIVGALNFTNEQDGEGRVFVYHGSDSGLEAVAAWTTEVDQDWAEFGWSVAAAGDVNGDDFDDVIVSARNFGNGQLYEGRALVFHGSDTGLEALAAWTAESNQAQGHFGQSVAGAGDVDADGFDDVIVIEEEGAQGVYVYHGSAGGLEALPRWTGAAGGSGWSVSTAGDVNGDGFADIIGAGADGAFVHHGSADGLEDVAAWTARSEHGGIFFGRSVSTAGDVNGDGFDDVVVGEYDDSNPELLEGRAFVYHGSAAGLGAAPAWSTESDQDSAQLGWSVSTAGDVNADGFGDVVIGAPFFTNGEVSEGRAFLFMGTVDDGLPCEGGVFRSGECDDSSCYVAGAWYLNGEANPDDACQVCRVATSQVEWTAVADLTDCPDGICHAGVCEAACSVDETWFDDDEANPDNPCETCLVATNPRTWTALADGSDCRQGLCRDGRCDAAECFVDGSWYVNAATSPDNACLACVVATDREEWTDTPEGAECEGGLCRAGACENDLCWVDERWFLDGAADPTDDCNVCEVATSRLSWSRRADCAGADGGPDDPEPSGDDGGCSCRSAGGGAAPRWLGMVLGAFVLVAVRLPGRRRAPGVSRGS
jgi:hypothetical protein